MRRPATAADLDAVFAIHMDERVAPYLGHDPMARDEFEPLFGQWLASGGFWIWDEAGQLAGFYRVIRYDGRAAHVAMLGTLAVRPDLHGRGVGERMVRDAIERLRGDGVKRIELYVEVDNPRGLAFYRRLGFEREAVLKRFYKRASQSHYVDEIVMARLFD